MSRGRGFRSFLLAALVSGATTAHAQPAPKPPTTAPTQPAPTPPAQPAPADDDAPDASEELFLQGRALMKSGDLGRLAEACAMLARSREMRDRGDVLLNLAECHRREGKTATAWREFDEAIRYAQEADFPQAIAAAKSYRDLLARQLLELRVEVPKDPAPPKELNVTLDGKRLPAEQWGIPLFVDPGVHTVTAEAKGYHPFSDSAKVETEAARPVIVVKLEKLPEDAPPPKKEQPPKKAPAPPPESDDPIWPWIVGGAGLAMMGGSIAFGVDTVGVGGELDDKCGEKRLACPRDYEFDSAHSHEVTSFGLFVGLGIAGIAATATGATMLLLGGGDDEPSDVAVAPWASPTGAGISVRGATW